MFTNKRGFTVVELVIVVCIIGIIASFTVAKQSRARVRTQNSIAQRHVATYATTARTAAMQRAHPVTLRINADSVWVTADSAGTELPLRPALLLQRHFGVTTTASTALVAFNARGFAPGLPETGARVVLVPSISGTAVRDTVCVSRTGKVRTRGCA